MYYSVVAFHILLSRRLSFLKEKNIQANEGIYLNEKVGHFVLLLINIVSVNFCRSCEKKTRL